MATPSNWPEVEETGLEPGRFTLSTVRARVAATKDPWAGFADAGHGLHLAAKLLARLDRS